MNIEAQSRALRQLAIRLVHDDAQADDLTQDAWVDALQNPPAADRPASPWLRAVLRNRRVTNARAHARRAQREQSVQPPPHPPSAEQIQVARELLEHMASLPEGDRDVLTLRYWEALTLNECAERLGITPSTARSRHARALSKLRERLDARTGGREAWMSALAPWIAKSPPPAATAAPMLSLASLSVGGVMAGACLWLLSGLNPGCGAEGETVDPEAAAPPEQTVQASKPLVDPEAPSAAKPPRQIGPVREVDFDAKKHPCDRPIAPEDAPSMADVLASGEKLTSKQFIAALLECQKLHGPSQDYSAPNEIPDGSVHPLLSAAMSVRQIWPAMRECYAGSDPAVARISYSFWLHEDGAMTVDDIKTVRSEGLNADEIACIESSVPLAETGLRKGDPGKLDLPAGTVLEMPRVFEVELKDSTTKVTGSGHRPPSYLEFEDKDAFEEQVAQCGPLPMGAALHWDPETKELLDVEADDSLGPKAGPCLTKLLKEQLKPRRVHFFPKTDADTRQHCTFDEGEQTCETDPLFRIVEP